MTKYRQEVAEDGVWSRWVRPIPEGYKMCCCDCGLVHVMDVRIVHEPEEECDRVEFRVRRDNRATGQVRRRMTK